MTLAAWHIDAEPTSAVCMRRAGAMAPNAPGPSTSCRKKVRMGRETSGWSRSMPHSAGSRQIGAAFTGALGEKRNHAAS